MHAYDTSFKPPAPVTNVSVTHPTTGINSAILRGKLDTGADLTVIPDQLIAQLGITPKGTIWTRGYDGTYTPRPIYYVSLTVESFDIAIVRCIATTRADILLGRNVLNHFFITLDGKNQLFELKES